MKEISFRCNVCQHISNLGKNDFVSLREKKDQEMKHRIRKWCDKCNERTWHLKQD